MKEAWHASFVFTSSTLEFEGGLARKLRFHTVKSWNLKDASHDSFVCTNLGCDLNVIGFARNIVFFRVNGASVAETSWLACATVAGVVALVSIPVLFARAVELMVPGDFFSSLLMLCYCVLHVLRHFVQWNCCIKEMHSLLQLLELEGGLARKRRFNFFNSWNSKDASLESFVCTNLGCDLSVRICTKKHCVFSGKRSFRCGDKLARVRDGCGRRRFGLDSCSFCARSGADGSR